MQTKDIASEIKHIAKIGKVGTRDREGTASKNQDCLGIKSMIFNSFIIFMFKKLNERENFEK